MRVAPYTMLFAGLALAVVLLGSAGIAGGTTAACVACHGEHADEWSMSAHATIACHMCHQRPGAIGVLEQRTRMLGMVGSALLSRDYERAVVPNAHCVLCHSVIEREVVESNGIRVRHLDLIDQGRRCVECHNTVTHGTATIVPRAAEMTECMRCHAADTNVTAGGCDTCHVKGASRKRPAVENAWRITHGVTWRYTHGLGDQATCRTCHPRGYCARCHGIDLPHPVAWNNSHGKAARSVPQSCGPCHEQSLCAGCHTSDMPHPDGFLPKHSAQARDEGTEGCLACHIEATCYACHEAHIHPGLTPERIRLLRAGGRR